MSVKSNDSFDCLSDQESEVISRSESLVALELADAADEKEEGVVKSEEKDTEAKKTEEMLDEYFLRQFKQINLLADAMENNNVAEVGPAEMRLLAVIKEMTTDKEELNQLQRAEIQRLKKQNEDEREKCKMLEERLSASKLEHEELLKAEIERSESKLEAYRYNYARDKKHWEWEATQARCSERSYAWVNKSQGTTIRVLESTLEEEKEERKELEKALNEAKIEKEQMVKEKKAMEQRLEAQSRSEDYTWKRTIMPNGVDEVYEVFNLKTGLPHKQEVEELKKKLRRANEKHIISKRRVANLQKKVESLETEVSKAEKEKIDRIRERQDYYTILEALTKKCKALEERVASTSSNADGQM